MLLREVKLLHVENLRFQWLDDNSFVPRNGAFNFKLEPNSITCLKASSGFGKTTLLNFICNPNATVNKAFRVEGVLNTTYKRIAILTQFSQEALHPTFSIIKQIHSLENSLELPHSSEVKILSLLTELGFNQPKEILNRSYSSLSGGQKQRICLLLILLKDPDLLILDEPSSALDKANTRELFSFLKKWVQQEGRGILCVSHQTDWIEEYCEKIYTLDINGNFEFQQKLEIDNNELKILSAENITFHYPKMDKPVISNFSYSFNKGQLYVISGVSGKGKSTLGKLLCGHFNNYIGELRSPYIAKQPKEADSKILSQWRKEFVYIPQNSFALLNGEKSFIEEAEDLSQLAKKKSLGNNELQEWNAKLNINGSSFKRPLNSLSGGERQKLILLLFLLQHPKMIVLDEPTAAFDDISKSNFIQDILPLLKNSANTTLLVLSHDPLLINHADHHIQL